MSAKTLAALDSAERWNDEYQRTLASIAIREGQIAALRERIAREDRSNWYRILSETGE